MSTEMAEISDTSASCSEQSDIGLNQAVSTQDELEQLQNENQRLTTANLQLRNEHQLMRTHLKDALEPLNNLNQQWMANEFAQVDSSSSAVDFDWPQSDGANNLPTIVLKKIFSHVNDTKTLLACRLVCNKWKAVIDNTAALMRKLTFNIIHPLFFMELSNIVPVVRSVKFDYLRPFTDEQLENMVKTIAATVESVTFNFDKQCQWDFVSKKEQIQHLVAEVLTRCSRLTELRIVGKRKEFMDGLILCVPHYLTSLTMEVENETEENERSTDDSAYRELVKGLHRLTSLTLLNSDSDPREDFDTERILSPVYEHMLKHPGVLKEFSYVAPGHRTYLFSPGSLGQKWWAKLYLIAGTQNAVINTDSIFNLDNLLLFDEANEAYPVNVQTCSAITKARYEYEDYPAWATPLHVNRIQLCTNLQEIQIRVSYDDTKQNRGPGHDVLKYLWQLKDLQGLSLTASFGTLSESNFAGPVSVRRLAVNRNVFDNAIYSSISVYFPNLVNLILHSTTVPDDLLISLARLTGLIKLELNKLPSLTDTVFLLVEEGCTIPAIATLATLKELKIVDCQQLTDDCLLNGILHNATLQSLTVAGSHGFTDIELTAITDSRLSMKEPVKLLENGVGIIGHTYTVSSTGF